MTIFEERRKWLADLIMDDAERFDMGFFIKYKNQAGLIKFEFADTTMDREKFDACGSAACLCGTALINSPQLRAYCDFVPSDSSEDGMLDSLEEDDLVIEKVAEWLGIKRECFFVVDWPMDARAEYRHVSDARDHKAMALLAITMMEYYRTDKETA